jgi:hypothetical protein
MLESPDGEGQPAELAARMELVSKQAVQIQGAAKSFAAAAGKGFSIEPQAAATLIESCLRSLNDLNDLQQNMHSLEQSPQLGQTPGAQVIAPFTQKVAMDPQGIMPAVQNLMKTLQDMMAAYKKASTNYEETNALVQQYMQQQANSLA